jgi:signal transduction histidine kinase
MSELLQQLARLRRELAAHDEAAAPDGATGGSDLSHEGARADRAWRFLSEAGHLLSASLDYETTLRLVAHLAVPLLADGCGVYVVNDDGVSQQLAVVHVDPEQALIARLLDQRFPPEQASFEPLTTVMRGERNLLLSDVTPEQLLSASIDDEYHALLGRLRLSSLMAAPLSLGGRSFGSLLFAIADSGRRFGASEMALAEELARRAAVAIENARLYREAQRAIQLRDTSLAQLDALLAHAPIGIGFLDDALRYARVNAALAAINGLPAAAHIGRTADEVIPALAPILTPLLRHQEIISADAGSGSRTCLFTCYPVPMADRRGLGVVLIDITERRALERRMQEAQRIESLGMIAAGVAHDFNNLLAIIAGNAELALADIPEDSPARASLTPLIGAARRASDLTRQMIAYAGLSHVDAAPLDLSELVGEMGPLLHASVPRGVDIEMRLAMNLPLISADRAQIQQVVLNLVVNAGEAIALTSGASGVVTISTHVRQMTHHTLADYRLADQLGDGAYVQLLVADTGAGMDASTRERIYDPFFSTKFAGRGLGLAAVLGIVRAHRGALRVDSVPGRGSTFAMLLPAV